MRYALLFYESESRLAAKSREEIERHIRAYASAAEDIADRGVLRHGAPLRPTATATTVRVRDGQALVIDGPFAETKEQLGGFFIVECEDLDEAIELAKTVPAADGGAVEIRPVLDEPAAQ